MTGLEVFWQLDEPVPVLPGDGVDSLAARVQAAEYRIYWRAIRETFCRRDRLAT